MSLDLTLEQNYCEHCKRGEPVVELNSTYNHTPMWKAIYPDAKYLVEIEGLTGMQARARSNYAIQVMIEERERMLKFEPSNGWGSYDTFLKFLRDIRNACEEYPDAVWRADR